MKNLLKFKLDPTLLDRSEKIDERIRSLILTVLCFDQKYINDIDILFCNYKDSEKTFVNIFLFLLEHNVFCNAKDIKSVYTVSVLNNTKMEMIFKNSFEIFYVSIDLLLDKMKDFITRRKKSVN